MADGHRIEVSPYSDVRKKKRPVSPVFRKSEDRTSSASHLSLAALAAACQAFNKRGLAMAKLGTQIATATPGTDWRRRVQSYALLGTSVSASSAGNTPRRRDSLKRTKRRSELKLQAAGALTGRQHG